MRCIDLDPRLDPAVRSNDTVRAVEVPNALHLSSQRRDIITHFPIAGTSTECGELDKDGAFHRAEAYSGVQVHPKTW